MLYVEGFLNFDGETEPARLGLDTASSLQRNAYASAWRLQASPDEQIDLVISQNEICQGLVDVIRKY